MKDWTRRIRRILAAACLLCAVALLSPDAHSAPREEIIQDWMVTPASQLRTLEGIDNCEQNTVCMELCLISDSGGEVATGVFACKPE